MLSNRGLKLTVRDRAAGPILDPIGFILPIEIVGLGPFLANRVFDVRDQGPGKRKKSRFCQGFSLNSNKENSAENSRICQGSNFGSFSGQKLVRDALK